MQTGQEELLARARAGDERAFGDLVESHLPELRLHCYRILGSLTDAEDALQEALVSAWRGLGTFEARSKWRTWLYHIATNRCLNLIRDRGRRKRIAPVPPFTPPEPSRRNDIDWLEPYPDRLLEHVADPAPGPETRIQQREAVELAFVATLQRMPARQAAALILCDVLAFRSVEVAPMLGITAIAAKGVLARARAALAEVPPAPPEDPAALNGAAVSRRFAEAFVADDIDTVVALLTDDAWLTMPPAPHEYQGRTAIAGFLRASARWRQSRRYRLVATGANTQPAFACYLADPGTGVGSPAGLIVLTLRADRIAAITRFMGADTFAPFGLADAVGLSK